MFIFLGQINVLIDSWGWASLRLGTFISKFSAVGSQLKDAVSKRLPLTYSLWLHHVQWGGHISVSSIFMSVIPTHRNTPGGFLNVLSLSTFHWCAAYWPTVNPSIMCIILKGTVCDFSAADDVNIVVVCGLSVMSSDTGRQYILFTWHPPGPNLMILMDISLLTTWWPSHGGYL